MDNYLYNVANPTEMMARAFACYVTDKLAEKGIKDQYLSGHSDIQSWKGELLNHPEIDKISIAPQGDEKKAINKAFDNLIEMIKEKGLFHDFDEKEIPLLMEVQKEKEKENSKSADIEKSASVHVSSDFGIDFETNNDGNTMKQFSLFSSSESESKQSVFRLHL